MKIITVIKKHIFLSVIITFLTILFGGVGLITYFVDSNLAYNQQKVLDEINKNITLKNEIGGVNFWINTHYDIIEKKEVNKIEYVKLVARGSKMRYAKIEYWVNKKDSIWKLDSLHVLEISDKLIKITK